MTFGTVLTAMVTPFNKDNQVDFDQAQKLAEYLINHGSDGLVLAGSTGESPTLSNEEKLKLISAIKEVVKGKATVVAGTSSYDTAAAVELTKKAESAGADGILAVSPYYNKPTQEGLYQHFTAMAHATSLPVMLYNIPGRCGVNILPETMARLAKVDNIIGNKESVGSMDQLSDIRSLCGEEFLLYSGDDSLTLPSLALGAVGVVSVASHLVGDKIQQMIASFQKGDIQAAREMHYHLLPLFKKIFIVTNPIPIKYTVNRVITDVGPCRLPLVAPNEDEAQVLEAMLKDYGLV